MNREETIQMYMASIMKQYPKQIAVECEGESISYQELHDVTDKIACGIKAAGYNRQAHVGVYMKNKVNTIYAMLGIMKAGCVFVPLDEEYATNQILHMVDTADVQLVLYDEPKAGIKSLVEDKAATQSLEDMLKKEYGLESSIGEELYLTEDELYIYFTSGTTGNPNAVVGVNKSLLHFILWEIKELQIGVGTRVSQFTSACHDPYLRDIFVPLLSGGTICLPSKENHILSNNLAKWLDEAKIQVVHCTPSLFHLLNSSLLSPEHFKELKYVLLAGEKVRPWSLKYWYDIFGERIQLINLYGPTETTLAKLFYYIQKEDCKKKEIPIGKPIEGCKVILVDGEGNISDKGEIYIRTPYRTKGYYKNDSLNQSRFIQNPFSKQEDIIYKTGDYGRLLPDGNIVFTGRKDKQIKIRGNRVEVDEIERKIESYPAIKDCVVDYSSFHNANREKEVCTRCGIPNGFPHVEIDSEGVCNLCRLYENNSEKINQYFKTPADFEAIFSKNQESQEPQGEYDCLVLYSGGKDSTYVLSKLLNMGLRVLAYFFDNGHTSEQAYQNLIHSFEEFKVDYVVDKQDNMNDIFLAGIKKESSVCNGCFKVLSYRSLKLAYDKGIKYIVTGFSRGQIFDLRLENIYRQNCFDLEEVESKVEEHRMVYFCKPDYVTENMEKEYEVTKNMFNAVTFLDFYHYYDVTKEDIYQYLSEKCSFWKKPEDTGKCSSNCLINDVGIYLQQRAHGYDNYTSKDCWETRLLAKPKKEEFQFSDIDINKVNAILKEIGYEEKYMNIPYENQVLKAYYVSDEEVKEEELKNYLKQELQDYMIPAEIIRLSEIPLTANKKVDYANLESKRMLKETKVIRKPRNHIEERIIEIWKEIVNVDNINVTDSFMDIGGNSLNVLNMIAQIYNEFEVELDLGDLFNKSTVEAIASYIEQEGTAIR